MSQFGQEKMNFFDDSHGQVPYIPSHICQTEDSNPLFQNESNPDTPTNTTKQQTKKREHTAYKVLLSVMHKILYWQTSTTKRFQDMLSQINKKHNNSTALKFIILAKKAGLAPILQKKFDSEASLHLNELNFQNQWSQKRFMLAMDWKTRIQKAINCRSIDQSIEKIWQGHKHKNKLNKSEDDVNAFKNKMKRIKKSQLKKSS